MVMGIFEMSEEKYTEIYGKKEDEESGDEEAEVNNINST